MARIGFADHLFLRMHHGIGNPVFNQFVWRFDNALPDAELKKLHTNLSQGLLARAVLAPMLPTARHRWVQSEESMPLDLASTTIAQDAVRCWAEQRVVDGLDPEQGTGWQLAAARIDGGGMVLSLVCSHMIADGAAMIAAVRQANQAQPSVRAADLGSRPSLIRGLVDDFDDTIGELKPIVEWAARTVADGIAGIGRAPSPGAAPKPEQPHRSVVAGNSDLWSPPYVVIECPADEWKATAAEWGGTSTSLFIGVMTALAERLGRARPGDELRWSLPYSDRDIGDLDANSTKIVPVRVPVSETADRDLTRIRKAVKTALTEFTARLQTGNAAAAVPLQLVQMLPDSLVARMPMPSDGAEGLCSNLGRVPDDFAMIGGFAAASISARAIFAGADPAFARSLGGGSTAWACETADTVTITVHGMDPDRIRTDEQMREAVAAGGGRK